VPYFNKRITDLFSDFDVHTLQMIFIVPFTMNYRMSRRVTCISTRDRDEFFRPMANWCQPRVGNVNFHSRDQK